MVISEKEAGKNRRREEVIGWEGKPGVTFGLGVLAENHPPKNEPWGEGSQKRKSPHEAKRVEKNNQ